MVSAQVEERIKIAKAVEAANKKMRDAQSHNELLSKAAADMVSKVQKDLHQRLIDTKKAQIEAYETEMCSLGLSAQVYPLETALMATDQKLLTPAIATAGVVVGQVSNLGKGLWNRFKKGYDAATK
jgi:hypothetical protein